MRSWCEPDDTHLDFFLHFGIVLPALVFRLLIIGIAINRRRRPLALRLALRLTFAGDLGEEFIE